MLGPTVAL